MGLTQVSTDGVKDNTVTAGKMTVNSVGNSEMKDDAIDTAELVDASIDIVHLSATGTAGNTTYLRGDNTWTVPPDTNTTYSVGDGGLTQNNFTDADHTKLDGIAAGAEVNVQSDWNATSGDAEILNKPTTLVAADAITGDKIADDAVGAEHIEQLDADLSFADTAKALFGAGNDLEIFHDGSNSYIKDTGTGNLVIQGNNLILENAAGANYLVGISGGETILYHNDTQKFVTQSGGCEFTGILKNENDGLAHRISLGAANDLNFYHDGTHSNITNSTGHLLIKSDSVDILNAADNEYLAQFDHNGGCSLYYDNSLALSTTADGIVVKDGDNDTHIHIVTNSPTSNHSAGYIIGQSDSVIGILDGQADWHLKGTMNGSVELYYDNTKKFETKSDGVEMFGTVTSTGNRNSPYAFHAHSTTSTSNQYYITFTRDDDTQDGYIASTTDGQIFLSNASDYRMKEDIVSMTNGIDIVKKLNPVTFKFKGKTDTIQGFIAHEVDDAGVLNAVIGTKDAVDSDDNPVYQGLGVEKIIPALTAALKEAIAEIETLKTEVAALKTG